ncbi:LytTR family DNA-binding domain-containing protein [uncultured Flavobacterium sp.]|uniref:LytR/AlgR family response regulator transcription factor n=1 Tax=uncultured Flavobacterium sp. TaxID=165435 RepID=UPI0030EB6825
MKLNCIVVDDSALQRITVTKLISENQFLHLVGEFSNATDAKNCISTKNIDLVFLDIEMPVINGFDFLDGLKVKPQIIFITVKTEYALKAFDYNATDYLHKPLTKERFNLAVSKAFNLFTLKKETNDDDDDFIFIKSNLKKLKIFTSKIRWIEAFGDYVKVITEDDNHLVLSTMKAFEKDLPADKFIRVHKSYIININKVETFNSKFAEIDTFKIPLSRNKKDNLVEALKKTS